MENLEQSERLDKIYFCTKCKAAFLFKSDTEDHDLFVGHSEFATMPFE
jgi:hypothetical protein